MSVTCNENKEVEYHTIHQIIFENKEITSSQTRIQYQHQQDSGNKITKCSISPAFLIEKIQELISILPEWDHPTIKLLKEECASYCLGVTGNCDLYADITGDSDFYNE